MIKIEEITAEQTYQIRHTVLWPEQPIEFIKLPEDKTGIHFGLFKKDLPISIVSLFINGKSAQFRKFATLNSEQGNGYGTKLLEHVINYVQQHQIETLWCNARIDKTSFYKRFGLQETTKMYNKGGISFIVLEKILFSKKSEGIQTEKGI